MELIKMADNCNQSGTLDANQVLERES